MNNVNRLTLFTNNVNRFGMKKSNMILGGLPYDDSIFITLSRDGFEAIQNELNYLFQCKGIDAYYVPCVLTSDLYNDFSLYAYNESTDVMLSYLFDTVEYVYGGIKPFPYYETGYSKTFDVSYIPDEFPPADNFYRNIRMNAPGTGFHQTILYGFYQWFNDFDWQRNKWNRAPCVTINKNDKWRYHPGRNRLRFPQFSDTTSPLIIVADKEFVKEHYNESINIRENLATFIEEVKKDTGYADIDIYLQKHDEWLDIWYVEKVTKNSYSGEMFDFYFGETLTVTYKNSILKYNDEPILEVVDGKMYFLKSKPKFKI